MAATSRRRCDKGVAVARADRCIRVTDEVGGVALIIDAKNDRIAKWYASYGALAQLDAPLCIELPLAVAADALKHGA